MTDVIEAPTEPFSTCGTCGQRDDHPKHQIAVGVSEVYGQRIHLPHDFDKMGCVHYHFDCESEWHGEQAKHLAAATEELRRVTAGELEPGETFDIPTLERVVADKQLTLDRHEVIIAKAKDGVHGDDLRQWIKNVHGSGGAGGIDQTMATAILAALSKNSSTATLGTVTITGPINMRLMTANGSDSSAGTQLGASAGYSTGGVTVSMGTASAGSVASNGAASWTNMPSCTLTGMEQWDTSGTPLRTFWAPWTAGSIVVASANSFSVASGSLTDSLS